MPKISKTAEVAKYFAQVHQEKPTGPGLLRKRLTKLMYESDLLCREYLGRPLTDLDWIKYKHGPYARRIDAVVKELVGADLATDKDEWNDDFLEKHLRDLGVAIPFTFSAAEMEILRYVAANYMYMPMPELMNDVVYPSIPYAAVENERLGVKLPMDMVNNRGKDAVGFDLEAILKAERDIDAGKFVTDF